ncbi:alpha/beta fold hydrolase [Roseomonas marmotae]|uniref:Alpha/beta hydrolase n=2 Tax=Roseomonas marmotae TaxID=2768161 RepID=A0ABS3KE18_9PROT|nr:alpha/beta hydrolase [Roseomonas marmotae]MBO1075227.1 alpha/beta hydrolase [Roseomonas marmotae]
MAASARLPGRAAPGRPGTMLAVAAALLGGMALANAVASRQAVRRHPPKGRFLEVDGVRLHYLDRGAGPATIVLLHGNGAMTEDFGSSGLIDILARRHRVIAFDRPGFGHSSRPRGRVWSAGAQARLLWTALHALGIARPVLTGHSWGALVAQAMAAQHPRETAALVLLSGYHIPGPRPDVLPPSLLALPLLGDLLCHTVAPLLNAFLLPRLYRRIFAPAPVSPNFRHGFPSALVLRPGQLRASAGDTALMIPSAAAQLRQLRRLTMPVIIAAGEEDRIVDTAGQSAALHARIPGSRFRNLPGCGHMIHHSATGEVARAIESALRAAGFAVPA